MFVAEPIPNSKSIVPDSLVVCGPTASGKSDLSDALPEADGIARWPRAHARRGFHAGLQGTADDNQPGAWRAAELVGIVSVTEEWSVARHRSRAEEIIAKEARFVLDAEGNVPERAAS